MIAFLRNPASQQVRTNNHVERCNRKLRYWEKVRHFSPNASAVNPGGLEN
jgi:transposase-like protein